MEHFKKIINRLLLPHIAVVIVSIPVAAALLIYIMDMYALFGNKNTSPLFKQIMTGATGGCVCLFILIMAVYMIVKSTKQLRKRK